MYQAAGVVVAASVIDDLVDPDIAAVFIAGFVEYAAQDIFHLVTDFLIGNRLVLCCVAFFDVVTQDVDIQQDVVDCVLDIGLLKGKCAPV